MFLALDFQADDCKCCTGVVSGMKEVALKCDDDGRKETMKAYIQELSDCVCNACHEGKCCIISFL